MSRKSQIVQFLLNVPFGPLGLFYSSWVAGAVFTLVGFGLATIVPLLGWLFVYPIVWLVGVYMVHRHNAAVRDGERRHRELVEATRQGASRH